MSQPPIKPFSYKFQAVSKFETLLEEIKDQHIDLEYSTDTSILFDKTSILVNNHTSKNLKIPNRLVIHPMEGCDGNENGEPTELTKRRYERFGGSGAGIIWFEATAVVPEGRANPRQLMLNKQNFEKIKELLTISDTARTSLLTNNPDLPKESFENPIRILQLTHSGRYSRPGLIKEPLRSYPYPEIDTAFGIDPQSGKIVTDAYLDALKERYWDAIGLAMEAGFDGVDIKSCHRYLISELLSGFTRENSNYGGLSFDQRTKFLRDVVAGAIKRYSKMLITLRLNLYDGMQSPFGWGVVKNSSEKESPELPIPDPSEPILLLQKLTDLGITLVNFSLGNPYYKPYLSRPYDAPSYGAPQPPESQLKSIERIVTVERAVSEGIKKFAKNKNYSITTIGSGFSWLRQWAPYIAVGEIKRKSFDLIGFGRMAFANPEFPIQIYKNGVIDHAKTCLSCSHCTDLMRFDVQSGCPIRDVRTYAKIYNAARRSFLGETKH
jgi:2,4-dienoyl-CoA reductase (NADPH2)